MSLEIFGLPVPVDFSLLSKPFLEKIHLLEILFSQNGEVIARDILPTIKVSNVFLAPDRFVYLTGSHGVYRRKRKL